MEASRGDKTFNRQVRSNVQVFHTVFFDCNGMVHHEFLQQGRTVNKEKLPWSYAPIAWSNSSETYKILEKPIMDSAP